jgi:MFS family permease
MNAKISYRWVIVAAGALITTVSAGAMFSLAVYLQPISEATGWSRAGISSAMTIDFLVMGLAAFGWGALSDRIGARPVVLAGGALMGIGQLLAARATSLTQFQLTFGLLVGIAAGSFFAPLTATVTRWFTDKRGLAVSLVTIGIGIAPMTMSPLARWLVTTYDWRVAMTTIGLITWAIIIPVALLIRRSPAVVAAPSAATGVASEGTGMSVGQALRSTPFIVLVATFFWCCAAHSGPIFHTISYAMLCGVPAMLAVSVYSVEGLSGLGGRFLFGMLADRYGAKPVVVAGLLIQACAIGSYVFVSKLGEFYLLAVILGAAYSGVMPLYALLAHDYFGPRIIGTVLGAASIFSSLGMSLGPVSGGRLYDTFHNYQWLYLSSFTVGLAAVAIALAFPPLRARAIPAVAARS